MSHASSDTALLVHVGLSAHHAIPFFTRATFYLRYLYSFFRSAPGSPLTVARSTRAFTPSSPRRKFFHQPLNVGFGRTYGLNIMLYPPLYRDLLRSQAQLPAPCRSGKGICKHA